MSNSSVKIISVSPLDWPSELPRMKIQRGTLSYHLYNARKLEKIPFDHFSKYKTGNSSDSDEESKSNGNSGANVEEILKEKKKKTNKAIDLNSLTTDELKELTYYEILGNIPTHSTPEQIKKAFHKACLKYHPDKEKDSASISDAAADAETTSGGNGKKKGEDPIFLKVKEAFETLFDAKLRKSYDSTVGFDESIPLSADINSEKNFYKMFGACFERNLRFAAENEPGKSNKNGNKKNGKKKNKGGGGKKSKSSGPPTLGDENTGINDVHLFYDYWVHFESWRDFTLPATKETEHDTDMADCRYEKRWMEKEISRKAKAMKKDEMARISKLVERSMSLDPRLKRERERIEKEKQEKIRLKKEKQEQIEREHNEREEREAKEKEERDSREKEERAKLKVKKEQEKKILRKAKQGFRKSVLSQYGIEQSSSTDGTWDSIESMNDDIELLCSSLSAAELGSLTNELNNTDAMNKLEIVVNRADEKKDVAVKKAEEEKRIRKERREAAAKKEAADKAARASAPWTKEELSALAKAVKKYPAGSGNRWGTIATYINSLCRLPELRSKEECIDKYNSLGTVASTNNTTNSSPASTSQNGTSASTSQNGTSASTSQNGTSASTSQNGTSASTSQNGALAVWSDEEDKQLQDGLAKFPSSMDRNERWTSISNCVSGRSKKECVQRFKAIRESLKKK